MKKWARAVLIVAFIDAMSVTLAGVAIAYTILEMTAGGSSLPPLEEWFIYLYAVVAAILNVAAVVVFQKTSRIELMLLCLSPLPATAALALTYSVVVASTVPMTS